jgi:8-oxo-dGTP diphosphatase
MHAADAKTTEQQFETVARVSLVLITVSSSMLLVATSNAAEPHLPARLPNQGASLDEVAQSQLTQLVGSARGYMEQLYTFSFDDGAQTGIVVSYLALTPGAPELDSEWSWRPFDEVRGKASDSDRIVLDYAIVRLRAKIGYTTIAFHLMPESFSLSDLQQTYETILGRPLDPRNFRRRVVSSRLLQSENRLRREGSHRPAALYRFAGNHDPASFLTPGIQPRRSADSSRERGPT